MSDVVLGEDGYLFLAGDTNKTLEQFEGSYQISRRFLEDIALKHQERSLAAASNNGLYAHLLVPNKETVLAHLMPAQYRFQRFGLTPYNLYLDLGLGQAYHSVFSPNHLRRLHQEQLTYARLDTHWTHFGALSYFRKCLEVLGLRDEIAALDSIEVRGTAIRQTGDLGRKIGKEDEDLQSLLPASSNSKVILDNSIANDCRVRVRRNEKALIRKRVLMHHDSTAEWIVYFIFELFAEVIMIHYPDTDLKLINSLKPDIFFFLQVERFFVRGLSNVADLRQLVKEQEMRKKAPSSALPFLEHGLTM